MELHEPGWVNEELQAYVDSEETIRIKDGRLRICPVKTVYEDGHVSYASGRISTQYKQDFTWGLFEARLKAPKGKGYLPAFWLMTTDEERYGQWPVCGEIDIMEILGSQTRVNHGTVHYGLPHYLLRPAQRLRLPGYGAGHPGRHPSGAGGAGNGGGKVLNIYVWNDEFQGKFNANYPEVEKLSNGKSITYLKDGTEVHWIINSNQDGVYQQKLDEALAKQGSAADGYYMYSGRADTYRVYSNNVSAPWVDGNTVVVDQNMMNWVDRSMKDTQEGINHNVPGQWIDEWNKDMGPDSKVFCFFLPA